MNKTYFEQISDIAEQGMELEQKIRLCTSIKANYEGLGFTSPLIYHKIEAYNRYERLLNRAMKRFKQEFKQFIIN